MHGPILARALVAACLALFVAACGFVVVTLVSRRRPGRERAGEEVANRSARQRKEHLVASNELRTLVGVIRTHTAQMRANARPEQVTSLGVIDNVARRLDVLLRQLFDVSAIQAGTVSLRRVPCDVAALVDRAITQHRNHAHERGIRLRAETPRAMSVAADWQRIVHALTALLAVALESARLGAEIVLRAGRCDDGVRFAIIDAGVTVALPDAFPPIVRGVPDDLGVLLALRVIETHGGRMGIETVAGARTYWFTLPSAAETAGNVGSATATIVR